MRIGRLYNQCTPEGGELGERQAVQRQQLERLGQYELPRVGGLGAVPPVCKQRVRHRLVHLCIGSAPNSAALASMALQFAAPSSWTSAECRVPAQTAWACDGTPVSQLPLLKPGLPTFLWVSARLVVGSASPARRTRTLSCASRSAPRNTVPSTEVTGAPRLCSLWGSSACLLCPDESMSAKRQLRAALPAGGACLHAIRQMSQLGCYCTAHSKGKPGALHRQLDERAGLRSPDAAVAVRRGVQQCELQVHLLPVLEPLIVRQRRHQRLRCRKRCILTCSPLRSGGQAAIPCDVDSWSSLIRPCCVYCRVWQTASHVAVLGQCPPGACGHAGKQHRCLQPRRLSGSQQGRAAAAPGRC